MRLFAILFVLIMSNNMFGQKDDTFIIDSVRVNFKIDNKVKIIEEITVSNLSGQIIYLPIVENKELFFFSLGNRLHSYFGIMSSMVGPPNLGGNIELKILKPKEKFKILVAVDAKKKIDCYSFSVDFLKGGLENLIVKKDNKYWIKTLDYVKKKKSFYYKQD